MATKNANRDFDVQQLNDTVQGVFAGKDAFMGSRIVSQGGVLVSGDMPHGRGMIGNEITIPYFGTIGEFEDVAEDVALTPRTLDTTNEKATVGKSGLAFEVTTWAQRPGRADLDPYQESARQLLISAQKKMDKLVVDKAATTPLVADYYSASSPQYLSYDMVVDAKAMWGDDQSDIIALVTHSRAEADLRKLRDASGRPILTDDGEKGDGLSRIAGIPIIISDRVPVAGSMTTPMSESGTLPDITLAGTPIGPWDLRINVVTTGTQTTAIMRFSTDGGKTWSANYTNAASVVLTDTAKDSLVGRHGVTGITATMAAGTYTAGDTYTSKANMSVSSLIVQKGALAFWYNRALMNLQTDKDILKDNDVAAVHMYRAVHLYRRRVGGVLPGVVAIKHNVRGFTG